MAEIDGRLLKSQVFLLKSQCINLLRLTLSFSSGAARDLNGGTELSNFRVMAGGAAYSQSEVLAEAIGPLLCPHPAGMGWCHI